MVCLVGWLSDGVVACVFDCAVVCLCVWLTGCVFGWLCV